MKAYFVGDSRIFVEYGPWLWNPRDPTIFEAKEKILIRQVGAYPICALDDKQHYTLNTIFNVVIHDTRFAMKYVLGILNSQLVKHVWKLIFPEQKDVFPRVKKEQLISIPIALATPVQQSGITNLVAAIMAEKSKDALANTDDWQNEIDRLVYQLYNLTEDEIKLIEREHA